MKKMVIVSLIAMILFSGCFTHHHTIGSGPHSGLTVKKHQWYALWGIIPIADERDGGVMAGTTNCRITTQFTPIDCLINFFTGVGTVYRRTIIVEK